MSSESISATFRRRHQLFIVGKLSCSKRVHSSEVWGTQSRFYAPEKSRARIRCAAPHINRVQFYSLSFSDHHGGPEPRQTERRKRRSLTRLGKQAPTQPPLTFCAVDDDRRTWAKWVHSGLASPIHPSSPRSRFPPLGIDIFPPAVRSLSAVQQTFVHGWPRMPNKKCSLIHVPRSPPIIFCTRPSVHPLNPSTPSPVGE